MRRYRGDLREPGGDGLVNRDQDGTSKGSYRNFGEQHLIAGDEAHPYIPRVVGRTGGHRSEMDEGDLPVNRAQDGVGKGVPTPPDRPNPISADIVAVSNLHTPNSVVVDCVVRRSSAHIVVIARVDTANYLRPGICHLLYRLYEYHAAVVLGTAAQKCCCRKCREFARKDFSSSKYILNIYTAVPVRITNYFVSYLLLTQGNPLVFHQ